MKFSARKSAQRCAGCFVLCLFCFPSNCSAVEPVDEFTALVDEMWEFVLQEDPLFATATGDHRYDDRLPAVRLADHQRRHDAKVEFLRRLDAIERDALDTDNRVNYDILRRQLTDNLTEYDFGAQLMPINQRSGFHVEFPELPRDVPLDSVADYENYLARLRAFGQYADENISLMREGLASERVLPAVAWEGWQKAVDAQITDDPEQHLLYKPLRKLPTGIPESEHDRLRAAAREAISTSVVPGYRRFRQFMEEEYVPGSRDSVGISAVLGGRDFYRFCVRKFTTLELTPEEVHQIGLAEVARIQAEMDQIIRDVQFDGDFAAFTKFLREDPQFYAESSEQLLKEVALVLKKMDGQLPTLIGKLPRQPYGLREVPDYIAPRTTAAYYQPPTGDGTKAGFFYMNTYNLKSRPLFTIEALSFHEAVPGHHLQIALQMELEGLPQFRRFTNFTAFVEGWALYAERLGRELGFYQEPYSDFGRLTLEMWRACRLVVDTGIHYYGWTRQQAIDYLLQHTALSLHDISSEVDRYITWPGQALAYKIGEMKIRELRAKAEERLGERFDLREFHDVVLGSGAVPLDVLEANVEAWLDSHVE
jgi:uncharacterized protein (DUF885 family)